jgi:hypothetical protein
MGYAGSSAAGHTRIPTASKPAPAAAATSSGGVASSTVRWEIDSSRESCGIQSLWHVATGSFAYGLVYIAALAGIGALAYMFMVDRVERIVI